MKKQRKTAFERELERHLAVCAMTDQANKDRARIAELEAALEEAREDSKRLEAVESGRLGIQYRDGVIRDEWKWSITYASTPIASAATLRAAIDAAREAKP